MATAVFTTDGVWNTITEAAMQCERPALIAVAYFGKGASGLLPVPPGSSLVVDVSESAVRSGKTHPLDLLAMHKRGVAVHSYPNLHAKVFVFGTRMFVGSPNASKHSARVLTEAMIETTEKSAVRAGASFVMQLCHTQLGPKELVRLQGLYRPPPTSPQDTDKAGERERKVFVVKSVWADVPDDVEEEFHAGADSAKAKRRDTSDAFTLREMFWSGTPRFNEGQLVVEVTKSARGISVSPPGHVIQMKQIKRKGSTTTTLLWIEAPDRPTRGMTLLPLTVQRALAREGLRSASTSSAILSALTET